MPPFPLLFVRHFTDRTTLIHTCKRENVVLHMAFEPAVHRSTLRRHLAVPGKPFDTSLYNTAKPTSPFSNYRFDIGEYGKVLEFQKRKNIIRAGKHTHADAFRAALFFTRWTQSGRWPTRVTVPNMVVSGKLNMSCPRHINQHCRATSGPKFPGVSLKFPHSSATPTVFVETNTFIIPGITSASSLETALANLEATLKEVIATEPNEL
jgi:hypothetical protein